MLILEVDPGGKRTVSQKVRNEKVIPVIDLNSVDVLGIFAGLSAVRVVVQQNRIMILPVASEVRAKRRLEKVREKVLAGEDLTLGATASGIGILDLAAHEGLASVGLESKLLFANEIRDDCVEHACERNPAYGPETVTITMPMQELVFDEWAMSQLPETTIFMGGVPCSGASVAGRSKKGLVHPEAHEEVGHLIVPFLAMVAKCNPVALVLENVIPYKSTASMSIMRNMLRDLGYVVHEAELDASEWNMIERRKRLCVVAVTKGIEFSFDDVTKPEPVKRTFGEIMDDVDPNHSTWGNIDYLWAKKQRDSESGKGFSPTIVNADSEFIPTQTANLAKRQSTGTFIQHPVNPSLYRIPTVAEHARGKGVWEYLVANTTQSFGHESLGQSISVPPFVSVFAALGRAIRAFAMKLENQVALPVFFRSEALAAA